MFHCHGHMPAPCLSLLLMLAVFGAHRLGLSFHCTCLSSILRWWPGILQRHSELMEWDAPYGLQPMAVTSPDFLHSGVLLAQSPPVVSEISLLSGLRRQQSPFCATPTPHRENTNKGPHSTTTPPPLKPRLPRRRPRVGCSRWPSRPSWKCLGGGRRQKMLCAAGTDVCPSSRGWHRIGLCGRWSSFGKVTLLGQLPPSVPLA